VTYFSVQLILFHSPRYFDRNIRLFVQQASEKRPKSGGKIGEKNQFDRMKKRRRIQTTTTTTQKKPESGA
jgi:hypothetical protein